MSVLEAAVPIVAFLLMVAVGLDVTRDELKRIVGRSSLMGFASLMQAITLPLVALWLIQWAPSTRVAEYLLLLAACPGGGMSNVYVYLARANTALSVTLTATSCMLAVLTMPTVFAAYGYLFDQPLAFMLPLPTLAAQLFVMTVVPVVLGVWLRVRHPQFERRHGRTLRALSAAGVAAIVVMGLIQSAGMFNADIARGGVLATVLVIVSMAIGYVSGAALRTDGSDRFALLVEFAVRNLAIAMVVEVSLVGRPDFIAFGALALLAQALLLGAAVGWRLRGNS